MPSVSGSARTRTPPALVVALAAMNGWHHQCCGMLKSSPVKPLRGGPRQCLSCGRQQSSPARNSLLDGHDVCERGAASRVACPALPTGQVVTPEESSVGGTSNDWASSGGLSVPQTQSVMPACSHRTGCWHRHRKRHKWKAKRTRVGHFLLGENCKQPSCVDRADEASGKSSGGRVGMDEARSKKLQLEGGEGQKEGAK